MEVNEKCDVYSFGVLTMEMLIGKHPGDLISNMSSSSSSAKKLPTYNILLKDVLDQRLTHPSNSIALEVIMIARLAFACLSEHPHSRPTMEQVCKKLGMSKAHSENQFHVITLEQLQQID